MDGSGFDWARIVALAVVDPASSEEYPAFAAQSPAVAARYASESDDKLIGAVVHWFEILSAGLPPSGYLLGERLTIGDIPVGQLISRWYKLPIQHPPLPRVRTYFELLSARPAYRDHVIAARALT
ncbi:MAG TPA: hypothetical protein VK841_00690 [Polyangiaceae bacterium]|jgi:glutathione S-transferase|nr:hypothetical protein [Polyangiaceae bacterium]